MAGAFARPDNDYLPASGSMVQASLTSVTSLTSLFSFIVFTFRWFWRPVYPPVSIFTLVLQVILYPAPAVFIVKSARAYKLYTNSGRRHTQYDSGFPTYH